MNISELVELIKRENRTLFAGVPEKKAALIVKAVLAQLGKAIDAAEQEPVKVVGFGQFRVRQVEREVEGQKTSVRRIMFVRAGGVGKVVGSEAPDA